MARTGGELLPASFPAVFTVDELVGGGACSGSSSQTTRAANSPRTSHPVRVFVDVGSGHSQIVRAAVEAGGFDRGIGIEKYR